MRDRSQYTIINESTGERSHFFKIQLLVAWRFLEQVNYLLEERFKQG